MQINKNVIYRFARTFKRVTKTHYPGFIFGFSKQPEYPVSFVYHDVDEDGFESDLQFLKKNKYATISIAEFLDRKYKGSRQKTVLLTFDDARKNFYETAFPLLKKYDARATLFVPTFWTQMHELKNGDNDVKTADNIFMNWNQLKTCNDSGHVDVESHGYMHALIYSSTKLETFASPEQLQKYDLFDWPIRFKGGVNRLGKPELGTPVYAARPLLSSDYRIIEDDELTRKCIDKVVAGGGNDFFRNKEWYSDLNSFYKKENKHGDGRRINAADFKKLMINEINYSSLSIEEHLNLRPKVLAYPWELGTALSIKLAAKCGYRAVFGVAKDFSRIKNHRFDIPAFYRIKGDWLPFLPGKGRKKFSDILIEKIYNIEKIQHLAH